MLNGHVMIVGYSRIFFEARMDFLSGGRGRGQGQGRAVAILASKKMREYCTGFDDQAVVNRTNMKSQAVFCCSCCYLFSCTAKHYSQYKTIQCDVMFVLFFTAP